MISLNLELRPELRRPTADQRRWRRLYEDLQPTRDAYNRRREPLTQAQIDAVHIPHYAHQLQVANAARDPHYRFPRRPRVNPWWCLVVIVGCGYGLYLLLQ